MTFGMNEIQATCVYEHIAVNDSTEILNDSIITNVQDSIISMDFDDEISEKAKALEAPVDTAMISLKSDSVLNAGQQPAKRWIPDSNKLLWMAIVLP